MTTLRKNMSHDLQLCSLGERMQEAYLPGGTAIADLYRALPDQLSR